MGERNKIMDYKKAYSEVDKELSSEKIELFKKEVKDYKLEQLEAQEQLKKKKEEIEDKLRIIKLNLENLDNGKFEAIEERMKKSQIARELTKHTFTTIPGVWHDDWVNGTYTTTNKIFYF